MNNTLQLAFISVFMVFAITKLKAAPQYSKTGNGIEVKLSQSNLRLQVFSPSIIRVSHTPQPTFSVRQSLSVNATLKPVKWDVKESGNALILTTDSMIVTINTQENNIIFADRSKKAFFNAILSDKENFTKANIQGEDVLTIKQKMIFSPGEGLFGLGQYEDGVMNYRGQDVFLVQANRVVVNPFLVSSKGYGILWDNYSESKFHDGADGAYFWSEVADEIDYYVVAGQRIDQAIAGYRLLTGAAPMFSQWAYGYWQSKEHYESAKELIGIVKEYRKRKIPIDNIVQDWSYWKDQSEFSGMEWDVIRFPDPKALTDTLHSYNTRLMVSIWPVFGPNSAIYKEMDQKKLLYDVPHWCNGKVYDAYSPEARQIYWKYVKKAMFDKGVDAYWMDGSEAEFRCTDDRFATGLSLKSAGRNAIGTMARYLNPYSLLTTKAVYENQRAITSDKRVFILTRSAFAGQQRNAAATWSGDIYGTWSVYKNQVTAGINFCMSGIPYWTTDIGSFITQYKYPNGVKDPAYRELYVRWFQFGTFSPLFRSHGTNTPREVWQFGDEKSAEYNTLVKFIKLRYRLMPYIYSQAGKVTHEHATMMRGLPMDFPDDKNTYSIATQFMFGNSLLICPVTKETYYRGKVIGETIPSNKLFTPDGKEIGLQLDFYKDTLFKSLELGRRLDVSSIGWFGCIPITLTDPYSARLTGQIMTDDEGEYQFVVMTDGDVKVWIDNKLIIDQSNRKENMFLSKIKLNAATKYSIKVEHRQFKSSNAFLRVHWITPAAQKETALPLVQESDVYLPQTTGWYDFWTGNFIHGGKNIKAKAPLDIMPLYVKAGSIVPLGVEKQYTGEKKDEIIELRVYTGSNGSFVLYEDEGETYNYEKGVFATISIRWNEIKQTLTFDERKGSFPGMLERRTFNVVWVKGNHGAGIDPAQTDEVVKYEGKTVKLTRKR